MSSRVIVYGTDQANANLVKPLSADAAGALSVNVTDFGALAKAYLDTLKPLPNVVTAVANVNLVSGTQFCNPFPAVEGWSTFTWVLGFTVTGTLSIVPTVQMFDGANYFDILAGVAVVATTTADAPKLLHIGAVPNVVNVSQACAIAQLSRIKYVSTGAGSAVVTTRLIKTP